MNKIKILFLILCSVVTLNASELYHADSYEDAIKEGIQKNKMVLLFAHSPFCPWCRKMEADTLSNEKVINYLNKNVIFVTVDLSIQMDVEDVPKRFIPQGTPTTYAIDPKTEKLMFTMRGYKNPKSFLGRLSR